MSAINRSLEWATRHKSLLFLEAGRKSGSLAHRRPFVTADVARRPATVIMNRGLT